MNSSIDIKPTLEPPKPKNRRGRGSRQRQLDKFRSNRNQDFQESLDQDLAKRIGSLKVSSAEHRIRDASRVVIFERLPASVSRPDIELQPYFHFLHDLVSRTMNVISQSRIQLEPGEFELFYDSLQCISVAQLEAKLFYARINSEFRHVPEVCGTPYQFCMRIAETANFNLPPIAAFLNQIGKFELDGQTFIPWCPENVQERLYSVPLFSDFSTVLTEDIPDHHPYKQYAFLQPRVVFDGAPEGGFPIAAFGPNGRQMFVRILDQDMAVDHGFFVDGVFNHEAFNPHIAEYVEADAKVLDRTAPNIDTVLGTFSKFQAKLSNRLMRDPMVSLNIRDGLGTAAQLVGCHGDLRAGARTVWASRIVEGGALVTGAVFQFGLVDERRNYPVYAYAIRSIEGCVYPENAIEQLVSQCLYKV